MSAVNEARKATAVIPYVVDIIDRNFMILVYRLSVYNVLKLSVSIPHSLCHHLCQQCQTKNVGKRFILNFNHT